MDLNLIIIGLDEDSLMFDSAYMHSANTKVITVKYINSLISSIHFQN